MEQTRQSETGHVAWPAGIAPVTAQEMREIEADAEAQAKMQAYVKSLGSTTGRYPPDDVIKALGKLGTKQEVNKAFFEWSNNTPMPAELVFKPEHDDIMKFTLSLKNTPAYRNAETNMRANIDNATRYMRDANAQLEAAANARATLMTMDKDYEVDLRAEIRAIVADGWFKFEQDHTDSHNKAYGHTQDLALMFSTPTVICKYYNKAAKADMQVEMGRYKVKYYPKRNKMHVVGFSKNADVNGYVHPHISGSGDVCWGNAAQTYANCMATGKPKEAFDALRIILQTYNDGSPYVDLIRFLERKAPAEFKRLMGRDAATEGYEGIGNHDYSYSLLEDYTVQGIVDSEEPDEDGDGGYARVETYRFRNEDGDLEDEYYVRGGNGDMIEVDSYVI